jgi:hypothetical protein
MCPHVASRPAPSVTFFAAARSTPQPASEIMQVRGLSACTASQPKPSSAMVPAE